MSYRREPRISDDTWILVADRAKATVFHAPWPDFARLQEVQQLHHPEGAKHRDEVLTDRPGRFAGPGPIRQSGEPQTDFRHQTAREFAIQLVDVLEQGRTSNLFGRLILVAPALMLGELREHLSPPLAKTIVFELRKELTDANLAEVAEHLQQACAEHLETINGRS